MINTLKSLGHPLVRWGKRGIGKTDRRWAETDSVRRPWRTARAKRAGVTATVWGLNMFKTIQTWRWIIDIEEAYNFIEQVYNKDAAQMRSENERQPAVVASTCTSLRCILFTYIIHIYSIHIYIFIFMYSLYFITFQRSGTRPVTKPVRSIRPEQRGTFHSQFWFIAISGSVQTGFNIKPLQPFKPFKTLDYLNTFRAMTPKTFKTF